MNIEKVDIFELEKISLNKIIFSIFSTDYLEITDVIQILGAETLPLEITVHDNKIFIRDLSRYMVINNLKPNIIEQ